MEEQQRTAMGGVRTGEERDAAGEVAAKKSGGLLERIPESKPPGPKPEPKRIRTVTLDNLLSAVISAGLASLFASVVYVVLAAPDVAMTEASIGSGLTTMIFLYAIRKTQGGD